MLRDQDIREPLFEYLETTYGKIRILEEKMMGRSRADVVMVTENAVCGLEIKSDADSYARLSRQVIDYSVYFDYNYAVVGTSHAMHIREHIPDWWGVITVEETEDGLDFYMLRAPKKNPGTEILSCKLRFLWRSELESILLSHNLPRYTSYSKAKIIQRLIAKVPEELLHRDLSAQLFERDYTIYDQNIRKPGKPARSTRAGARKPGRHRRKKRT